MTDEAIQALSDPNGEIEEHFVKITKEETTDPNMSICAGVRWLIYKKKYASRVLKRPVTWPEAIAAYKGCLKSYVSGKSPEDMGPFTDLTEGSKSEI